MITVKAFSLEAYKSLLYSYAHGRPAFKVFENFSSASRLKSKQSVVLCCKSTVWVSESRNSGTLNLWFVGEAKCTQVAHEIAS